MVSLGWWDTKFKSNSAEQPTTKQATPHWLRLRTPNIHMAPQRVWESARRKFPTQVAVSLAYAHSRKPHTYSRSKASSSAPTPLKGTKSQPSLQAPRPQDISGVPTLAIDATLARSTLMPPLPTTMVNSSTTSGTNTLTTVNSAGTLQLDA